MFVDAMVCTVLNLFLLLRREGTAFGSVLQSATGSLRCGAKQVNGSATNSNKITFFERIS